MLKNQMCDFVLGKLITKEKVGSLTQCQKNKTGSQCIGIKYGLHFA